MRNYHHFSKIERLELSILLKKGYSPRQIALEFGRSPSSVNRELKRNSVNGVYAPLKAQHKAYVKRLYSKYQGMKIRDHSWLEDYVRWAMTHKWSPQQIANRLNKEFGFTIISHRVIYKYLYSVFGEGLCRYLKYKQKRLRRHTHKKSKRGIIKNRVFIEQRPTIINHRSRRGDFEGDLMGKPRLGKESLAAIVDRRSRMIFAKKVKRQKYALTAFNELLNDSNCARTLTLDNALEHANFKRITVPTYFCQPYSSWQKGTVENTFTIVREYIPKKAKLENYTQKQIDAMLNEMNNTPRKCLGYKTPLESFTGKFRPTINTRALHLRV